MCFVSVTSFKSQKIKNFFALALGLFVIGCSSGDDEKFEERPVESLYQEGMSELKAKRSERAAKIFDEVERQHPYSEWATQAQLMAAYAHYENQKYEKALAAVDGFIALHPAHPDVAYAYYLQGLCYYEQVSPVERDQQITELAYDSFEQLVQRFPKSDYAKDAKYKLVLLKSMRAGKEMEVGRYYQNKKSYVAAMNRFRVVVKNYQDTVHIPEALHRLVEVYLSLGLKNEAQQTAAVLGHNFPDNPWYAETYLLVKGQDFRAEEYRQEKSWIQRIWKPKSKV